MMMRFRVLSAAVVAMFVAGGALASGSPGRQHEGDDKSAEGLGVLNTIDGEGSEVNITHEPIPALKWPQMTMDLPVTGQVDLGSFKEGDKVQFTVKLNEEKVFQINIMCITDETEVVPDLCAGDDAAQSGA